MCPQSGEEIDAAPIDGTSAPARSAIADMKLGKAKGNPLIRPGDYIIVTEADLISHHRQRCYPTGRLSMRVTS